MRACRPIPSLQAADRVPHTSQGLRAGAENGRIADVMKYLALGADVKSPEPDGQTALQLAVGLGVYVCVRVCVSVYAGYICVYVHVCVYVVMVSVCCVLCDV